MPQKHSRTHATRGLSKRLRPQHGNQDGRQVRGVAARKDGERPEGRRLRVLRRCLDGSVARAAGPVLPVLPRGGPEGQDQLGQADPQDPVVDGHAAPAPYSGQARGRLPRAGNQCEGGGGVFGVGMLSLTLLFFSLSPINCLKF